MYYTTRFLWIEVIPSQSIKLNYYDKLDILL